jgi:hypothetical protein
VDEGELEPRAATRQDHATAEQPVVSIADEVVVSQRARAEMGVVQGLQYPFPVHYSLESVVPK